MPQIWNCINYVTIFERKYPQSIET